MPRRKPDGEPEPITARPRAPSEEARFTSSPESGLSVVPEELGAQFLSNATEQGGVHGFEASDESEDTTENGEAEAQFEFDEASFDLDPRGWERRITRSLRFSRFDARSSQRTGTRRILAQESEV